eukprot:5826838-Prymnesium_polylepis.1
MYLKSPSFLRPLKRTGTTEISWAAIEKTSKKPNLFFNIMAVVWKSWNSQLTQWTALSSSVSHALERFFMTKCDERPRRWAPI